MRIAAEPVPPARWRWRVFSTVPCPAFERTRGSLAIHEAGHAVASLAIGFPHVLVTLGALHGRAAPGGLEQPLDAIHPAPSPRVAEEAAVSLAVVAYAGLQAELLALGLKPGGAIRLSADDDERVARAQLRAAFGCSTPAGYCQILARSLLSQNWHLVERIAAALIEHGALRAQIAEPGAMVTPGYSEIWNAQADGSSPRRVGCFVMMDMPGTSREEPIVTPRMRRTGRGTADRA